MTFELPYAGPRQAIGLLGGSFDPPHAGHVHISREALKRFGLDAVWWLVSPGNPLKSRGPAPMEQRMAAARALVRDPRIQVTDLEARLGTRFTAATLSSLQSRMPRVRFVWLMGADNLAQFHKWDRWHQIIQSVPMGILARPGDRLAARTSVAAARYAASRVPVWASQGLALRPAPAWCFVNVPMIDISSTQLRAEGTWRSASQGQGGKAGQA